MHPYWPVAVLNFTTSSVGSSAFEYTGEQET